MQENIMGTKSMTPLLFSMALPIMLSMLIQSLYNVVDSIFVAQLGEDALAAVSLAFPVQQLMIAVSVGTSVGVNAIVSRRLGQRDQEGAERAANSGILLMVISWLAFALTGFFGADLFFSIFTQNAQVAEMGAMYLRICMVFGIGQERHRPGPGHFRHRGGAVHRGVHAPHRRGLCVHRQRSEGGVRRLPLPGGPPGAARGGAHPLRAQHLPLPRPGHRHRHGLVPQAHPGGSESALGGGVPRHRRRRRRQCHPL